MTHQFILHWFRRTNVCQLLWIDVSFLFRSRSGSDLSDDFFKVGFLSNNLRSFFFFFFRRVVYLQMHRGLISLVNILLSHIIINAPPPVSVYFVVYISFCWEGDWPSLPPELQNNRRFWEGDPTNLPLQRRGTLQLGSRNLLLLDRGKREETTDLYSAPRWQDSKDFLKPLSFWKPI